MSENSSVFIVFEGGGVEYDPHIHGIFNNLPAAQKCLKSLIKEFVDTFMLLSKDQSDPLPVVDKQIADNHTYFYIFQDAEELSYGGYANVFVIAEIKGEEDGKV